MCDYARDTCDNPNTEIVKHPIWGKVGVCDDCAEDFEDFIESFNNEEMGEEE